MKTAAAIILILTLILAEELRVRALTANLEHQRQSYQFLDQAYQAQIDECRDIRKMICED